jgi:hypothetical protein
MVRSMTWLVSSTQDGSVRYRIDTSVQCDGSNAEIAMTRSDEIKRMLNKLDDERTRLMDELHQAEREEHYRTTYLGRLVEADIAKAVLADIDTEYKLEVLRWLIPSELPKYRSTIKGWVLSTIDDYPQQLTAADLRDRFRKEFPSKRVASLRQFLTQEFVQKPDGKLVLTKKGLTELKKLERTERR